MSKIKLQDAPQVHKTKGFEAFCELTQGLDLPAPDSMDWRTVSVKVDVELVASFTERFHALASGEYYAMYHREWDVSAEMIRKYITTLFVNRIRYVRGERHNIRARDSAVVPALFGLALSQIGVVRLQDFGLEIMPDCDVKDESCLSLDEFRAVTLKLMVLRKLGCVCLDQAFETSKEGEPELMIMQVVKDEVVCHNNTPTPTHALICAFLGLKQVQSFLNPLIRYGNVRELTSYVDVLLTGVFHSG